jgi:hypothetical protein
MMKGCGEVLNDEIISRLISVDNKPLFVRYQKFKLSKLVSTDKNLKFCPEVNCGSFARRSDNKYVKCENGHKFCFECTKNWHGKKKCEDV